jgi:hypothetical protein
VTDARSERADKMARALERANALTQEWDGDMTLISRSEAADLFASVLELNGWTQVDSRPPLRAVPDNGRNPS